MKTLISNAIKLTFLSLVYLCLPGIGWSQSVSSDKKIHLIVPFPAGGGTDVPARLIASELAAKLGQTIVVENRPGAAGNTGADYVAKAAKDGTTLLIGTVNITSINPLLYTGMTFDPARDLAAVSLLGIAPNVLVVSATSPIQNLSDLIGAAKRDPEKLTFASAGSGTTLHLAGEMLKISAGISMTHVPYKGAPVALPDVISGNVTTMFVAVPAALGLIKAGRLRPLAVSGLSRVPALKDVLTIDELGIKGFDAVAWHGVFVAAGTPPEVISRLNTAIASVVGSAEIRAKLTELGIEAKLSTPQQLTDLAAADKVKWARVVQQSGAKID